MSEITLESFRWASSRSFSLWVLLGGADLDQVPPVAGMGAQPADGSGGTKLAGRFPRSVIFASQTESSLSVFGRPGSALTCEAW